MTIFLHYFIIIILITNWINPKKDIKKFAIQAKPHNRCRMQGAVGIMNITLTYCNSLCFERIFAEIQSGTKKNHKTVKIWQSFGYRCDMFSTNQNLKWNPLKCTSLPSWHLQFELIYITENYPSCQKFVKNNHVKRALITKLSSSDVGKNCTANMSWLERQRISKVKISIFKFTYLCRELSLYLLDFKAWPSELAPAERCTEIMSP